MYLKKDIRKEQIIKAALIVAERTNYLTMTRNEIADEAGCAPSLVNVHFKTMTQLRRAVMRHAAMGGHNKVLAQGLSNKDPHALKATREVKRLAGQSLLG